jgi:hypothetical protein
MAISLGRNREKTSSDDGDKVTSKTFLLPPLRSTQPLADGTNINRAREEAA